MPQTWDKLDMYRVIHDSGMEGRQMEPSQPLAEVLALCRHRQKLERLGRHGTPNKQPTNENPPGTLLTPVRNPSPGLLRFLNCPTPLCLRPLTHSATVHFWLEGERGETPCTHEPSHTLRPRTPRGEVLYFFLLLHLIHILAAPLSKSNPYRRANLKIISANP